MGYFKKTVDLKGCWDYKTTMGKMIGHMWIYPKRESIDANRFEACPHDGRAAVTFPTPSEAENYLNPNRL